MICLTPSLQITRLSIIFHGKEKKDVSKFPFRKIRLSYASPRTPKIVKSSTKNMDIQTPLVLTSGALKSMVMFINAFVFMLVLPFKRVNSMAASSSSEEKPKERRALMLRVPWRSNSGVEKGGGGGEEAGIRREIAIKRVYEDNDKSCIRDCFLFLTPRNDLLFTQSWTPKSVAIKGLVVLLHGLNEHSGRYTDFAKQLNANGYKVYGMDWIGHGGSDGLHGYVHSLDDAINDLKRYIEKVVAENPRLPCFCFGHSTGAAIILKVIMDPKLQTLLKGVVLTSPAVRVQPSQPIFGVIAPMLSFLVPKYQLSAVTKKRVAVSRDPEALIAKYSDPLVYTGFIRARTGSEILRLSYYLQRISSRITCPFLVLHGTADTVTDPEASKRLYEEASTTDKSMKLYEGYLHDLMFEPEKETIAQDIIQWLNSRMNS